MSATANRAFVLSVLVLLLAATRVNHFAAIPDAWLPDDPVVGDAEAQRAAYRTYVGMRLAAPRPFVEEADRARRAA